MDPRTNAHGQSYFAFAVRVILVRVVPAFQLVGFRISLLLLLFELLLHDHGESLGLDATVLQLPLLVTLDLRR